MKALLRLRRGVILLVLLGSLLLLLYQPRPRQLAIKKIKVQTHLEWIFEQLTALPEKVR